MTITLPSKNLFRLIISDNAEGVGLDRGLSELYPELAEDISADDIMSESNRNNTQYGEFSPREKKFGFSVATQFLIVRVNYNWANRS